MDAVGSNIRVDTYGWEVKRVLPRINEDINEEWISDKTRYACDGLLNQRLDTPLIKYNKKFEKASWNEVINIIKAKVKETKNDKICGLTGDLTNMETLYIFKEFFNKSLNSKNLESRNKNYYLNPEKRENYLFNSTINGIEESDFIFIIGSNPRYEATMLNARIRKSFLRNKTKIVSLNNVGDLTYPYSFLNGNIQDIKNIVEEKHEITDIIKQSKKPLIILGQSAMTSKFGKYIFESIKRFLIKNDKINNEWNALNIISEHASSVGSFDLGIYNLNERENSVLSNLKNNNYELIFLLGQDSLEFKKNNEFIIYQGSHGDKGAEISDIILPGAAYTEQDGYYTNLEGKLQKAYKASYPPGDAKEDWQIINDLSEAISGKKLFNNKDNLESSLLNYLKLFKDKNLQKLNKDTTEEAFINGKIEINNIDYYYSNVIARASKTMFECRNEKHKLKATGTEG